MSTPDERQAWVTGLMDRYERSLIRCATAITGRADTAREVVQDTFCRCLANGAPDCPEAITGWLFTVCRNRAIAVRRKETRMTLLTEPTQRLTPVAESPPARAEQAEAHRVVRAAIDRLPAKQQEVVRLRFQDGLSYREIAAATELTVTNVGYLLHTAVSTLRDRLTAGSPAGLEN